MSQGDEVLLSASEADEIDTVPAVGGRVWHPVLRYVGVDGLLAVAVFLLAWIITVQVGVGFNWMVEQTWNIFSSALLVTLWIAGTVGFIVHMATISRHHPPGHNYSFADLKTHHARSFLTLRNCAALGRAIIILMLITAAVTNVKPLIPLVNPRLHDDFLLRLDIAAFGGFDLLAWFSQIRTPTLDRVMNFSYMFLFYAFMLSVAVLFVQKRRELRVLLLGFLLAKLIGNAIHFAIPSVGDVYIPERMHLYENLSPDLMVRNIQHSLWASRMTMIDSPAEWRASSPFIGVAAFPSLHCALFTLIIALAWRCHRWLLLLYLPLGILLSISTLYFGWHYVSDCIGGILLGIGVYLLALRLLDWERRQLSR